MKGEDGLCAACKRQWYLTNRTEFFENAKKFGDDTHVIGSICLDKARLILFACEFHKIVASFSFSLGFFHSTLSEQGVLSSSGLTV